jgi:negative regulator of flagellin synthesis FlgM
VILMKINKPTSSPIINPYLKQQAKANQTEIGSLTAKKDQIQISTEAKALLENQTQIDPARKEKIAELKNQIQTGEYKINSREIAEKMYQFWFQK